MQTILQPIWESIITPYSTNKKAFKKEVHYTNFYRYKIVCFFIVIYAIILLFVDSQLEDFWKERDVFTKFYYMNLVLLIASLVFLTLHLFRKYNTSNTLPWYNKMLVYVFSAFLLTWSAIYAGIETSIDIGFPTYILTVFVIGTIFYLNPLTLFIYYITSMGLLFATNYYLSHESGIGVKFYSAFALIISAWLISRIHYTMNYKNFSFKQLISETNKNLDNLVKERTNELTIKNRELQNSIMQLKKSQIEIQKSRAQKKAILDNLPFISWLKDKNGIYVNVNEPFAEMSGLSLSDIIGKTTQDIWPNDVVKWSLKQDKTVVETKEKFYTEEAIKYETGVEWIETFISPIFNEDGELIGTTGIARNITTRKEAEERLKEEKERAVSADKLKTLFLADFSHKIKTPVSSIMGFSELLKNESFANEKQKKYIQVIANRGQYLNNIVNDIMDISNIASNQLELVKDYYDVGKILNDLHEIILNEKEIVKKESPIQIILNKEIPPQANRIYVDGGRLKQIIYNLLSNALKFTNEGEIVFGCKQKENDPSRLLFYVKDTGIGIPKEKHFYIFEAFKQYDIDESKDIEGTGLGLAISKGLLKLMNGKIWLDSAVKNGSTFNFTIPFDTLGETPNTITSSSVFAETEPVSQKDNNSVLENKTILVVEDDLSIFKFIQEILSNHQINVIHAENAQKAIEIVHETKLDLILMDIQLPGINGYEATKEIRVIDAHVPIIANTANALPHEKKKSLEAGCTDYLPKPFTIENILDMIKKHLP